MKARRSLIEELIWIVPGWRGLTLGEARAEKAHTSETLRENQKKGNPQVKLPKLVDIEGNNRYVRLTRKNWRLTSKLESKDEQVEVDPDTFEVTGR